jgi:hypothetical protein
MTRQVGRGLVDQVGVRRQRCWLSNTAFTTPEHLIQTIWHGMRKIQYRFHLIDGCLTGTGLSLAPTT